MILLLVLVPTLAGLLSFAVSSYRVRRGLLLGTALVHAALTGYVWSHRAACAGNAWLAADAIGLLFLAITSLLFLAAAVYAVGYLSREGLAAKKDFEEGLIFTNQPEAVFTGCLLFFLATMTLVCLSQHLGLLWVAIEATTLASAPLIYYHRHHRSLEATWKYLLICSVGIALALLGTFFLVVAASPVQGGSAPLFLRVLLRPDAPLQATWVHAAFIFLVVGYGTKMGLAPLHTWLPDAHSESPSVVSALLSGALLNCAFLGILRVFQVCAHAGEALFAQRILEGFGILSMVIAAAFIVGQPDYKRLLAYSSVEHMGILALGLGLGGGALFGTLLHAVNHSLTKGMLFLVAGNVLAAYQTKSCAQVRGLLRVLPVSGILWVGGFLAITGTPPFGPFISKFIILKSAFEQGHWVLAVAALAIMAVIFAGMAVIVLRMAQGEARPESPSGSGVGHSRERLGLVLPPALLGLAVVVLGLYVPASLEQVLHECAALLGATP